jgi:serine/threonine-protein kinase
VCSALALAHARGVVHRDLKPSNLFAAECADGTTQIKVLDFGLAKYFTGMDASLPLTGGNAVMGSPRYMSPEQMRASKDVDLRTDLWSLGAILYELLTGSAPFAQRSILALCEAVSSSAPLPPSVLRGAIPPALDDVVLLEDRARGALRQRGRSLDRARGGLKARVCKLRVASFGDSRGREAGRPWGVGSVSLDQMSVFEGKLVPNYQRVRPGESAFFCQRRPDERVL